MATKLCEQCRREHPGRECDYDSETGWCSEIEQQKQEEGEHDLNNERPKKS